MGKFKMKGHALPGINQRGYKSKINEGKPGAPKTTDKNKDEMSDEEKMSRAIIQGKIANWNKANPNATQSEMNKYIASLYKESSEKSKEKNKKSSPATIYSKAKGKRTEY